MSSSLSRKTVEFEDCECVKETEKAILVCIEGDDYWIPKSQVDDDSEVYEDDTNGTLVITEWFASKEGLF